jgi:hypothetical protein
VEEGELEPFPGCPQESFGRANVCASPAVLPCANIEAPDGGSPMPVETGHAQDRTGIGGNPELIALAMPPETGVVGEVIPNAVARACMWFL